MTDDIEELEKPYPCDACGDPEGRSPWDGSCRNHDEWVLCSACGASWPLVEPLYFEGTPDVRYLPNGDPGYPGDPPEYECPACFCVDAPLLWGET